MGFAEAGCGWVAHQHSYGIVYRGLHCSKNRCWTKWNFWSECWFASRVSTESTVVCCCRGCCFQRGEKWSVFRVAVCWWPSKYGTNNGAAWQRVADWRASLLGEGLKVNAGKSKVMFGSSFRCRRCDGTIQEVDLAEDLMVDGGTYECVKSFCYLGDILDGDGGADLTATATIRNGWMKFREFLPILTSRAPPLEMKGRVYASCVGSSMTYGSETRPLLVDVGLNTRWRNVCRIELKAEDRLEDQERHG